MKIRGEIFSDNPSNRFPALNDIIEYGMSIHEFITPSQAILITVFVPPDNFRNYQEDCMDTSLESENKSSFISINKGNLGSFRIRPSAHLYDIIDFKFTIRGILGGKE